MLEGYDPDLNYLGTERTGRYTDLHGGIYILRLKGANDDGVWNEAGLSVRLTVVPPFWETSWFWGLLTAIVIGGAIAGYRIRVMSVEGRNRELEEQIVERTKESERRRKEFLCLPDYVDNFYIQDRIASFLSVRPPQTFHVVEMEDDHLVKSISPVGQSDLRVNGGFFIFKKEIFDYMREGEELVIEPFQRLIDDKQLLAYRFDGFWAGMDTFKEKQMFEEMYTRGEMPWAVWKTSNGR